MNETPVPSGSPKPPVGTVAPSDTLHTRPVSRRSALIAVGSVAALMGGAGVYRWRASRNAPELTEFNAHRTPRALGPLRFSDVQGTETSLNAFRGRVVLLNVWATWCPPCREEMPTLDRLQAALGGPTFEVVAVSIDSQGLPVVQTFFRQIGIKHLRPYIDTFHEVGTLGATGIPATLLIDRDGREAARKLGPATWDHPKVMEAIRRFLPPRST